MKKLYHSANDQMGFILKNDLLISPSFYLLAFDHNEGDKFPYFCPLKTKTTSR
jgi:hypothetical protein